MGFAAMVVVVGVNTCGDERYLELEAYVKTFYQKRYGFDYELKKLSHPKL